MNSNHILVRSSPSTLDVSLIIFLIVLIGGMYLIVFDIPKIQLDGVLIFVIISVYVSFVTYKILYGQQILIDGDTITITRTEKIIIYIRTIIEVIRFKEIRLVVIGSPSYMKDNEQIIEYSNADFSKVLRAAIHLNRRESPFTAVHKPVMLFRKINSESNGVAIAIDTFSKNDLSVIVSELKNKNVKLLVDPELGLV